MVVVGELFPSVVNLAPGRYEVIQESISLGPGDAVTRVADPRRPSARWRQRGAEAPNVSQTRDANVSHPSQSPPPAAGRYEARSAI
jgi:hypothetical protein